MNPLLRDAAQHQPAMLHHVRELVALETFSADKAGLAAGVDRLRQLITEILGEPDTCEELPGGDYGDTLRATYPGTGPGRVLVIGHYDTVWPTGTFGEWGIRSEPDASGRETLSAPGIFDMKTGLVMGLWALRLLLDARAERPTVTFLFNGDEEVGSISSRPHIEAAAHEADAVFVLEPTAGGAVKTGRKGIGIFEVEAHGIEAHAGLNPTLGANAIHALAEFITQAVAVADLSRGTSLSVGLIRGGSASNVSAGYAHATLDIRVQYVDEMRRVDAALDAIRVSDERVSLAVKHDWNRPPMSMQGPVRKLYEHVEASAAKLGHTLTHVAVGGASDANFVAALDVPVLCGLGAEGDGAHARNEFIYPDQIPLFTAITAQSISDLAQGWR